MKIRKFFHKLFNGGLDPAVADPKLLGERRTISVVSFLLVVSSLILISSHLIMIGTNNHRVIVIGCVLVTGVFALFAQAYKNWKRLSALSLISALWLAPVILMFEEGFTSSNWAWLLPVILLANFIMSRRVSIFFTLLSILVMAQVSLLTVNGLLGYTIEANVHAITVAVSGSLIFVLACTLGYFYRTGQLRSEERLNRNMNKLAQEVKVRREAELKALAGERAKATFLTTVSHELRTPLNGVIGAGELLASKELDPNTQELVSIIQSSGEILLEVINNVLDLSRLDEGKLNLEYAPTDIREITEKCLAPLSILSKEKGLELRVVIDQSVPKFLLSDGARIRQLVINLCGNAIKFTTAGVVEVSLTYRDSLLSIKVRDTGIGIEKDKLSSIFTPFSQIESNSDRRFGGSGLGLSIVSRLVDLFGGTIEVQSTLGEGTEFSVSLPHQLAPPEARELVAKTNSNMEDASGLKPAKILVTDDNEINRKVATQLLKKLGHMTVEAKDGVEALSSIEGGGIDLVLMDVQMPNMDGLTATSRIRSLTGRRGQTPIIGLTANAMPGDEAQMRAAGMNGYLSKPVRLEKLKKALSLASSGSAP